MLEEMEHKLDDYDALDQIDILCARLYSGVVDSGEHRQKILMRVALLPDTALVPLRASGMAAGF